jgi:hypothetical protein
VLITYSKKVTNPSESTTISIHSTHGDLNLFGPAFSPDRYTIIPNETGIKAGLKAVSVSSSSHPTSGGRGMYWEADEAARCIRDGKLQSSEIDWEESILIMEVMDEVRKQNGLVYPEKIESLAWPAADGML